LDGHDVIVASTDAAEVETFWNPRKQRVASLTELLNGVHIFRERVQHTPFAPLSFYVYRRLAVELSQWPSAGLALRYVARLMPWVPRFDTLLRELPGSFDLVHGVNIALEWPLIAAWRYARERSIPFVTTPFVHVGEQGTRFVARNYTMPHQLEALRGADAVIVQTDIERECLAALGIAEERMHTLGMGVDLETVQGGCGERFRAKYGIGADEPIVLFMGVVTKDKGAVHLVEAIRQLWTSGVCVRLVIAGRPVAEFESYWNTLPSEVTNMVICTGTVVGEEKKDLFAAATVFALPSRIDSFGIVFLEAWANSLPVIGARAGGIPAVIDENRDGLLVDYGNISELALALRRLLGDEPYRKALGAVGAAKVASRYTWSHIYQKLLQIYKAAMKSGHTRDA
jgi:glycosyltransferase involved in cell wall biosynthesis